MLKVNSPNGRIFMVDGKVLKPERSQRVFNHSPDGFSCGYGGSGPSQLALAICLLKLEVPEAVQCYRDFCTEIIATWPQEGPIEVELDFDSWYQGHCDRRDKRKAEEEYR